jgi:XTP/dITP diphosphohydrolase
MKLILATRNVHKIEELSAMLSDLNVELLSFRDFPDLPEVVEDGETLEDNAIKKAREISQATGLPALADDTGLEVATLGGAPGVISARYAGEACSYDDNNRKLIHELEGVPDEERKAAFRCVVALAVPGGEVMTVEGRTDGVILREPRGDMGFGYDPIFLPNGHTLSYAEMSQDEKNTVSHRGRALEKARELIARVM